MKLGSLFDGSGTAPLAATMCGIEPVWASEIEPYPIKVTKARFPNMKHLGSILDIDGAVVEPVDIICGGSPCQDLSVAGKQKGLHEGERSHLFFEMTRIIKQMREETNGKYPRYVIWENVPGAFSSNKGADFLAVLQTFAEIADPDVYVPEPESKAGRLVWKYAGEIMGDGWSVAWRTVDAQYWGVPQRRRRIYLVADLGSERAGEILFERESVSGNHEPSRTQRKETAADAGRSVEGSSEQRICSGIREAEESICRRYEEQNRSRNERTSRVDFREANGSGDADETIGRVKCLNPWDSQAIRQYDATGVYPALSSNETGGLNRQGIVQKAAGFVGRRGAKSGSVGFEEGVSPTPRQGITTDCVYALKGTYQNTGIGWWNEFDIAETLRTPCGGDSTKANLVVRDCRGNGTGVVAPTLTGDHQNRVTDYTALAVGNGQLHQISMSEQSNCLDCMHDQQAVLTEGEAHRKYIVRRLTPLECCRLQGFPDYWMDGVEGSDTAKYKMWGNGMVLPNMLHVMKGIARMEAEEKCT